MKILISSFMYILFLHLPNGVEAAVFDTTAGKVLLPLEKLSSQKFTKLSTRYQKLGQTISKTNRKALDKMKKQEARIRKKMQGALNVDSSIQATYKNFEEKIKSIDPSSKAGLQLNEYLPNLDSLQTGLRLLEKIGVNSSSLDPEKVKAISSLSQQLQGFQKEWQKSKAIQDFIRNRRTEMKEKLKSLGMIKELQQLNKQVYYFQQQLNQYRELLKRPDQLVSKLMGVLRDQPLFKDFMANNSQLAQLFRIPGASASAGSGAPIQGLQTRAATQQLLTQQLQVTSDPSQFMQQQVQQGQAQLNQLKHKVNTLGGGSSEFEMPDFKPNEQKTKSFLQRIELGMNIQSQRPNGLFPVTTDLALTAGYKLNDKSSIGIGAAYKMGWGKNISNIKITHQGVGLRSFLDIKLNGSIWISGGYELNHQQEFNRLDQLKDLNAWQRSGLIGLSKKYSIGKKKGNLQLLWDFLSYEQVPRTQALKFRIGYVL